jgi:hypothetical protein
VVAGEVVVPGLPGYDAVHKPATARFREQSDRDLPVPGYWLGACVSDGQPYTCSYAQLLVLDGRQSGSNTCLGSI